MASAPCAWEVIPCGCELNLDNEDHVGAVEMASYVLWALSGRQFGCCEMEFRPCRSEGRRGLTSEWGVYLENGKWYNIPCRSCRGGCSCDRRNAVKLPHTPACEVVRVVIDGEDIPEGPGGWWLEPPGWVVLAEGLPGFPGDQNFGLPLGEPGTSGVVYSYGTEPPTAGKRAAGALACEIIKACSGANSCLPRRTQMIVKQGLTAVMLDAMDFFDKQRTGIYEVDLFLAAANPYGRPAPARITSPDWNPGAARRA